MGGLVETEGQMSALAGRTEAGLSEDEARVLGVEAYLYLYSLVTMELTRRQMTNLAVGERPAFGPMGTFSHVREFPPLELHPPHVTDWSTLARLGRIGLRPGQRYDHDALDSAVRGALDGAPAAGLALLQETLPRVARVVNGWEMNTDTMGVYGNFYVKRAIYPLNVADADGAPMDGDHDYRLHFDRDELPPVEAFWSVTMYDADGFQAANPLNRFAIGDRDPLRFNNDGSLDLCLQHHSPGPDREANWLPAPRGPLGVTMRLYAPAPQALDGRWNPPPITSVDR